MTAGLLAYPDPASYSVWGTDVNLVLLILLTFPASQLAAEWVNYLITRILPARQLPKLDFSERASLMPIGPWLSCPCC